MHNKYRMPKYHIPFILALLFFVSCSKNLYVYDGDIPVEFQAEWNQLLKTNPFPADIHQTEKKEKADVLLTMQGTTETADHVFGKNILVVHKQYEAPYCEYSELAAPVAGKTYPVKRLDEIHLPEKALPYEGRYPGNPQYGLVHYLTLEYQKGTKFRENTATGLSKWWDILPLADPLPDAPITIACVGDIMVGRGVDTILLRGETGLSRIFSDTLPILQNSDLTIGNLEGAVTLTGAKVQKSYNFRFSPTVLKPLKEAGFDYFCSTNNHVFDFGQKGFIDTVENLKKYNVGISGAGMNLNEALSPWERNVKNTTIRILSMADFPAERSRPQGPKESLVNQDKPGILWPTDEILQRLDGIFTDTAFNIVMIHGGIEWHNQPSVRQAALYRKLIDIGVDMVVGSHPHVLQPIESYHGGLICYSLGNFVFPGMQETQYGEESVILRVGLCEGEIKYLDIIPVKINTQYLSRDKDSTILNRLDSLNQQWQH